MFPAHLVWSPDLTMTIADDTSRAVNTSAIIYYIIIYTPYGEKTGQVQMIWVLWPKLWTFETKIFFFWLWSEPLLQISIQWQSYLIDLLFV